MEKTIVHQFLELYPDEVRHPFIAENLDWDNWITPVLVELGVLYAGGQISMEHYFLIMRCVCENIYVMGMNNKE